MVRAWIILFILASTVILSGCSETETPDEKVDVQRVIETLSAEDIKKICDSMSPVIAQGQDDDTGKGTDEVICPVDSTPQGCVCKEWDCSIKQATIQEYSTTSSSSTTSSTTTTTTCETIFLSNYEPQVREYRLSIKGGEFKPNIVEAFLGDYIIINITNKQGSYMIKDTANQRSIRMTPGNSYVLNFTAVEEGDFLFTCAPFCKEPMEAKMIITRPYYRICN